MVCYFCSNKSLITICKDCQSQLIPKFRLLPALPNICLGAHFYNYSEVIQTIIRDMKFRGNILLGKLIQDQLLCSVFPDIFKQSDVIVYVRSHWFRQLLRGRPHIPYLFHHLIDKNDCYQPKCLKRVRLSSASYGLSRQQRQLKGDVQRFAWCDDLEDVSSVTILDDVCTTGSTLSSIAALLKSYGIDEVKVLVVAYVNINQSCIF